MSDPDNRNERDERDWNADKRDFVADRRDDIADEREEDADSRETAADERDRQADERERELNERERQLDVRAEELGVPRGDGREERRQLAAARDKAGAARRVARDERDESRLERESASDAREDATKRRMAATPMTGLALVFAEIARFFCESDSFDQLLTRIVETAVATVVGCDIASVTIKAGEDDFRTVASTDGRAIAVDEAQYDATEGPCLEAVDEPVVYTSSFPDQRWPRLGERPLEWDVQSVVSYRLAAPATFGDEQLAGSLNAYAGAADAFDQEAQEIGLVLAAHGSIAIRTVREREALDQLGRQIHDARSSRDVIGQAKGILMERLRLTPEDAFDALRRSSQQLNIKLREVAQRLVETGEWDDNRAPGSPYSV